MSATNYYKVMSTGLGIASVFPFDGATEAEAFRKAQEHKVKYRGRRIAVYRRTALHPECLAVGECADEVFPQGLPS